MGAPASHDLSNTGVYSLLSQRFFDRALAAPGVASLSGWTESSVDTRIDAFFSSWDVSRCQAPGFHAWLATNNDSTVMFQVESDGSWAVKAAGPDQGSVDRLLANIAGVLPPVAASDGDTMTVRFWALGPMGPMSYHRRLAAAPWSDVRENYPAVAAADQEIPTRSALESLMTMSTPTAGGRLILLHGPPGTGKTNAIRALAQSLAPWCAVDYVVDVDAFFDSAAYMVGTMVMEDSSVDGDGWRLVVLEDSGEYLRKDASDKVGLGLGRLLNLADGLVGQGLRLLILMTTNEPIEELHPAVTREGRCMAKLRMGPFTAAEAARWMRAHGITATFDGDVTLAELYARLNTIIGEAVPVTAAGRQRLRWSSSRKEPHVRSA